MKKLIVLLFSCCIFMQSAFACQAFYESQFTQGMGKVCIYNHLGTKIYYNIKLVQTCPLTVHVPH